MKVVLIVFLIIGLFCIVPVFTCSGGCADEITLCRETPDMKDVCKTYPPCGLFEDDCKDPDVRYKVSVGNIVASIIFIETIFVPVVLAGWFLREPVGYK